MEMAVMIKVYGSPKCSTCMMVKDYLTKKGVEFEYHNIYDNPDISEAAKSLNMRALPIILKDGRLISGFNKKEIDEVIG
jgi:arsenate reductase-like glutaredoxin family protein